ncbi:MAG: wax ester/triacylglycerol synthase family O-acyltransferase [Halioglobus sp.]
MATVRQLGKEDILFVAGETDTVYHHTAGLVILDTSHCPRFSFEYLRKKVIERISAVPHFRWKLHEVPMGLDLPYWVEDENFRYENHFRRIAVPAPGDRQALSEVVAYLYSRHLDRSKPLWEFWLIEGLAGGKYAILQKLHHCMMDGQGASKLGELLCDFEPRARPRPVDAAISGARAGEVPNWLRRSALATLHLAGFPGAMTRGILDMVGPRLLEPLRRGERRGRDRPETPVTCFNGAIGSDRGFVFGSLSLDDIKKVRKAFDVSVNDVLLALVSSALRHYLLTRDELPPLALRTGIPISLRTDEDAEISNRVTQVSVTLATDVADPVARLRAISEECAEAKALVHRGGKGFIELIQVMPPLMVTAMMSAATPEQTCQMLGSNLIVSNVHGSDKPMYVAGARMETMYPMSIITPGMGLNFTCVSYCAQVDVGLTIEPQLVPDPWEIIDGLSSALRDYLRLAAGTKRRANSAGGRRAGAKARTRTKAKPKAKTKATPKAKTKVKPKARPAPRKKTPATRTAATGQRSGVGRKSS